ncbi:LysR substrate-binding domain-containing protein [Marimonas arenosa]|uniref:LysR substrate-binding domain-containing protein n=1 Tax=Marimonas arenosa TaxID=1795305 RepID=A0AAE4B401_9RHOB|nr:LysR substrate-binding domain-containing protein [Marimonas arenosa]MDQ2088909.1 LysR substrate-binding domain-containing protein [Marimonas arenosa]
MTLGRIRMRHIRCFLAVARLGTVTRAAEALGTVQPSVSRSLRELEQEIGAPLFDRSASGLSLNEAGRTLLSYVSNGVGQIDRGFEVLRGQATGRRVVAYVLPNVVRMIMPGAVQRFKTHFPDVDVTFLATIGGGLQEYLREGRVDFGFGRLLAAEHMEGMNFEHLFNEPLVFFARTGHPLADREALSVHDIDAFQVVMPIQGTIIRTELDRFLIAHGLNRFTNLIETISFEFARNYMMESEAVVCQPLGAMRRELDAGQVVRLDFGQGDLVGAVGITTPGGKALSAPAQLLVQMIRDEVQSQSLS